MSAVDEVRGTALATPAANRRALLRARPRSRRHRRVAYLYLAPVLAVYGAFLLVPLGHSAWLSLYHWDGLSAATWAGLSNYADAFRNPELRGAFEHSLILIAFYAVVPVAAALVLAGVMARASRLRFLSFFRVVLFVPQVVASVVVATTWSMILAPNGALNSIFDGLGLHALSHDWLGDFSTALPSVGVIGTWTEIGFCLVLFLAGIGQIPRELYDAARVDGAGAVAEFFAVTLPGIRRQLIIALGLTITAALRNFDVIYITTRGGPGTQTTVPAFEVYHRAFEINQVGSASAIGIILLLIIAILVFLVTRLDRS
jgi:raffinose/stachyose/melibiose transport system permease protein